RVRQVLSELEHRGIRFKPHFWVSEDWFSPHNVPGCAVPFYLLHPRLTRLERSKMCVADGAHQAECLRILRHEVGHAVDHAYRLYLRRRRQQLFGKSSKQYPDAYLPRPFSRRYVQNLDYWYAQAHPDEDFAETFAVWLQPRSNWRQTYQGWPALKKLEYVDELMEEIADETPRIRTRMYVDPLCHLRKTLRDHYAEKQQRYGTEHPDFYDADLRKLFSSDPKYGNKETAASFLRRLRPEIRRMVSSSTGHYQYSLDQVLTDIIGRCQELKLRVVGPREKIKIETIIMLTVNTMNFVYTARRYLSI
ncbi:hypothetical protein LCGC14_2904490, partial [marine sediment metagenome]